LPMYFVQLRIADENRSDVVGSKTN